MVKNLIAVAVISLFSVTANAASTITSLQTGNNAAGAFKLESYFTIASGFTGTAAGDITSVFKSLNTSIKSGIDLTNVTLSVAGLTTNEVATSSVLAVTPSGTAYATTDRFTFSTGVLSAGTYKFTFFGTAYGAPRLSTTAGTYTLTTTALPVPEPEYFSMMGLGLALVGLMARRRQA